MSKTRRRDKDGIYRRPDSPYYWASYVNASGKRTRRSTGSNDRTEATAILSKWKVEAFRETTWDEQPVPTFDEMMLSYLENRAVSSSVRSAARHLVDALGGCSALSTVSDVRQFIRFHSKQGRAPGTINKMLVLWSAALNEWNRETGSTLPNPVSGQKLREPEGRIRWLTKIEAKRLIDAAGYETDHLADAIALTLYTGMRRDELLSLEWSRVDLQAGLIHLQADKTKSKRGRTVPLSEEAKDVIRARSQYRAKHCPGSRYVICSSDGQRFLDLKRSFKTALRTSGIDDFRWHDLRHTFAAWLITAGVRLPEVRDLLGHSSIRMTERYAHLAPENLRAAVQHLPDLSHDKVTLRNSEGGLKAVTH